MTKLEHSARIEAMISADYDLTDLADSCCTFGFDNDGSTGFEIFQNGFELAEKVASRLDEVRDASVYYGEAEGQYWFFIGESEDQIVARLKLAQIGILETRVVRDKENDCNVWCVRFRDRAVSGSHTMFLRARQEAYRLCPHPWGTLLDPQRKRSRPDRDPPRHRGSCLPRRRLGHARVVVVHARTTLRPDPERPSGAGRRRALRGLLDQAAAGRGLARMGYCHGRVPGGLT